MIKYFCDICGVEKEFLAEHTSNGYFPNGIKNYLYTLNYFNSRLYTMCLDCKNDIDIKYFKLSDELGDYIRLKIK